jgi:hypothetical protein
MFGGYTDGPNRYCSLVCYTSSPQGNFCRKCLRETIDKSPGNTTVVNTVGTRLVGAADRCPTCHSIVQSKRIYAGICWSTEEQYRVIYVGNDLYFGRKIKTQDDQSLFLQQARRTVIQYLQIVTAPAIENPIAPSAIEATWDEWVFEPLSQYCTPVFTEQESNALRLVHGAWLALVSQIPSTITSFDQLHCAEAWPQFLNCCCDAYSVFMVRGDLPVDETTREQSSWSLF